MKNSKAELVRVSPSEILQEVRVRNPMPPSPEYLYGLAVTNSLKDRLRAVLADQTIENTARLFHSASFYSRDTPEATEEFRDIIQAYVQKSIKEMWGGEL